MSVVTSPIPGPNTDDDRLKMQLLLPHIFLAAFLILLALVSFIHYHFANKESKADAKFTEELKTALRRPRAGQGFPSTLVGYFGVEALNRESFDFTKYLSERAAARQNEYLYALRQHHQYQQQQQQYHQHPHGVDGMRAIGGVSTVAPSGYGRPYITQVSEEKGYVNADFLYDEEFRGKSGALDGGFQCRMLIL